MPTTDNDDWLSHFESRLVGLRHAPVFWLSKLILILSLLAVLWSMPTPEEFLKISPLLNWGSALLMVTAVYYFIISLPLAIGMLPLLLAVSAFEVWFASTRLPVLPISLTAVVIATLGLCLARGSVSAVVRDVQLSMIAPAYLMSVVYRKYGIPI